MTGGAGNDVFVFNASSDSTNSAPDRITDFNQGRDKIDLVSLLGATDLVWGGTTATINGVWYQKGDEKTYVYVDIDGNIVADLVFRLDGRYNLLASDFLGVSTGAVNHAPVNTVPGAQTVDEDSLLSISGVSVNDVDGNLATTQLSVLHGTLNVTPGGATISAGANGSASLTLSGNQVQINTALATLSYQGVFDYNGTDTLTLTISVTAVNAAPETAATAAAGDENAANIAPHQHSASRSNRESKYCPCI